MRIERLHIDGFGPFCDFDVEDVSPGLNVVLGENEAGKSTLLDFVRGMLFGFADRRSPRSFHEPLRGGTLGGSLVVATGDRRYTILRRQHKPAVVSADDGSTEGEAALATLLGHVDKRTYESIFAFGLDELADVDRLHEEGVRDRIFSAGISGAGRSATQAIADLEAARALLVRSGRRGAEGELTALVRERSDVEAELRQARRAARSFDRGRLEVATLRAAVDRAGAAARALEERGGLLADLDAADVLESKRRAAEDALAALPALSDDDGRLLAAEEEIRTVAARSARHEEHEREARELRRAIAERSSRRDALEAAVGASAAAVRPPTIAEQRAIDEVASETRRVRHELAEHVRTAALRSRDLAALDPPPVTGDPDVDRNAELLRGLVAELRAMEDAAPRVTPRRWLAIACTVVGVALLFSGVVVHRDGTAIGLASAGVVAVALGAVLALLPRGAARREDREGLARRIAELAVPLGMPPRPAEADLRALDAELRARDLAASEAKGMLASRDEIARGAAEARAAADALTAELATLATRASGLARGLGVGDVGAEDLPEVARAAGELAPLAGNDPDVDRLTILDGAVTSFVGEVDGLFARLGRAAPPADATVFALAELARRVEEVTATRADRAVLERERAARAEELDRLLARHDADDVRAALDLAPSARAGARAALDDEIAAARHAWEEAVRVHHDAETAFAADAASTAVADLELRSDDLAERIARRAARAAELGAAAALVKRALSRYEVERQPAVVARASELFGGVTGERYSTLVSSEDDQHRRTLRVHLGGRPVEAQRLSRGTAEQLYLCVRLAYAATFAERAVGLPLVLDDVLVNFDPARLARMAAAITRVADGHQVFVFTCHPTIADAFDVAPIQLARSL